MNDASRASLVPAAWDRASARERVALGVGAAVVIVALLWALAWQPMTRDLEQLREQAPRNAATLLTAHALADDISSLERGSASPRADLRTAVERTLAEQGLRAPAITLETTGDRVRATVPAIAFAALVRALDALRSDAAAYVVEGTVTPRVEPGTVRAELVLAR